MTATRLKIIDWASAVVIAAAVLWVALPSWVFLRPEAMLYDGRQVTSKRLTPFGAVYAVWDQEMYVVGTHMECHAPQRLERFQPVPGDIDPMTGNLIAENTVTWMVGDWALDCLRAAPPIIATHTWRVMLLGVIPLRPVRHVVTIERSLPAASEARA